MEFSDINKKHSGDIETNSYENTKTTNATLESAESSKPQQTGQGEGLYEQLRLEGKVNDRKSLRCEEIPKRIKYIIYITFALLIVLYMIVIALIVFVAVPKEKEQDVGWSLWENWGSCTNSCGSGVRTRSRSCTNPSPSLTGRSCTGDYTDVSTCNRKACPEHNVAFTAYNILQNSSGLSTLLFQNTYINNGNAYNTATGNFTCNVPGVYHFVVTLTKRYRDTEEINAYLRINGSSMLPLVFKPKADDSNEVGVYMLTGAGTFHLDRNDVVYVDSYPEYFYESNWSYFTGFLITPDQY
ncbi:uncharacterized protein LOC123540580 isoform X2 [Mercenaria mercenaria]|uniref:uncharacterized protein LOC123540580 isoform X2 n=1 Tax=Mercenaria mercenaria TaxID=6596 RepID=UPI00234FB175|nr:uncharacterized protein LOC123540580 isoform X2 [Mercenaria mercenaria]